MDERKVIRVYVTKQALTSGIFEAEGKVSISSPEVIGIMKCGVYIKPDWHETKEGAIERAKVMRDKAIKSTERKLKKLKDMVIDETSIKELDKSN